MELDQFVAETLSQILKGISDAQLRDGGPNINAVVPGRPESGNLLFVGKHGVLSRVDFDIAVTAETTGSGKASIKVWSIGAEAGGERRSQSVSRVCFSVPVRLPDGDKSRDEELRRADLEAWEKASGKRTGY